MSTKATIAHGERFHFYRDVFEDDHVYLELTGEEFEARNDRVTVRIPLDVWAVIRRLAPVRLDLADKSDDEIRAYAEAQADERIAEYEEARRDDPGVADLMLHYGAAVFGAATNPRDEQIASAIEHYTEERERQRRIAERIAQHRSSAAEADA